MPELQAPVEFMDYEAIRWRLREIRLGWRPQIGLFAAESQKTILIIRHSGFGFRLA